MYLMLYYHYYFMRYIFKKENMKYAMKFRIFFCYDIHYLRFIYKNLYILFMHVFRNFVYSYIPIKIKVNFIDEVILFL